MVQATIRLRMRVRISHNGVAVRIERVEVEQRWLGVKVEVAAVEVIKVETWTKQS